MNTSASFKPFVIGALCIVLFPAVGRAQPVPDAGQVAAGGEFGIYIPTDEQLDAGIVGGGLLEFYVTPRVGIRGSVMAMRNGYDREDDDDERQIRFGADVIYNWEFGAVHPFLGAGIGMHLLRFYRDGDNEEPNDTEFGGQVLGGLEFFLDRDWTVKTEARYQWVADRPNLNPDGLALTLGLKRYF